jgi:hypothetical protein
MINLLIIALGSLLIQLILPWWSLTFVAFSATFFRRTHHGFAFLQGFLALFLLWGGLAWYLSAGNDFLLATRISEIFGVSNPFIFILFTGLLGGVVGGFSALTGSLCRSAMKDQ